MCQFFGNFQILSMLKIFILIPIQWGWFFFQLFNWFQLFSSKKLFNEICWTRSKQVKNDHFERGCRWFQLENCLLKFAGHGQNKSKMIILKGVYRKMVSAIFFFFLLISVILFSNQDHAWYTETCLNQNLIKPKSCINQTLNKVPM